MITIFKFLFNRWVIIFGCLILLLVNIFWKDMTEAAWDSVRFANIADEALTDADVKNIKHVLFSKEKNNPKDVQISDMKMLSRSGNEIELSVRIKSKFYGNDFPMLEVSAQGKNGNVLRIIKIKPNEYTHSDRFKDEVVTIRVEPQPGESRFVINSRYES